MNFWELRFLEIKSLKRTASSADNKLAWSSSAVKKRTLFLACAVAPLSTIAALSKPILKSSRRFNRDLDAAVPSSQIGDLGVCQRLGNHTHDFMVTFAAAVIFQLFAQVDGLLACQIGCAGHGGDASGSVAQPTCRIGFDSSSSGVLGLNARPLRQSHQQYKSNFFHVFLVKKRGLRRGPALDLITG